MAVYIHCAKIIWLNNANSQTEIFPSDINPLQFRQLLWGFYWRGIFPFNALHALCWIAFCENWVKRKKRQTGRNTALSHYAGLAQIKHAQFSSLLRPLAHFPIQSRKSGYSECVALIQCLLHMQTRVCMCASTLNMSSKVIPLGKDRTISRIRIQRKILHEFFFRFWDNFFSQEVSQHHIHHFPPWW